MRCSLFHLCFFFAVFAIDCFKCVSYNGANKACDDPFHNNYSTGILESPCMGGRKGRNGLFPATACIKIAGYYGKYFIGFSPFFHLVSQKVKKTSKILSYLFTHFW